jgi:hypothetical protein
MEKEEWEEETGAGRREANEIPGNENCVYTTPPPFPVLGMDLI